METGVSMGRIWPTISNVAQHSSSMMSVNRAGCDYEEVTIKLERSISVE
jgi:hypothetical protein